MATYQDEKFKSFQQEVNRACKGEVNRKGLGFIVTYSAEHLQEDIAADTAELTKLNYEPVVQGRNNDKLFIPLYLSKYPG